MIIKILFNAFVTANFIAKMYENSDITSLFGLDSTNFYMENRYCTNRRVLLMVYKY